MIFIAFSISTPYYVSAIIRNSRADQLLIADSSRHTNSVSSEKMDCDDSEYYGECMLNTEQCRKNMITSDKYRCNKPNQKCCKLVCYEKISLLLDHK